MIEYITCEDCLRKGKEQKPFELYMKKAPIIALQCPHCGNNINNDKTLT